MYRYDTPTMLKFRVPLLTPAVPKISMSRYGHRCIEKFCVPLGTPGV
jgi:hypothetical protein